MLWRASESSKQVVFRDHRAIMAAACASPAGKKAGFGLNAKRAFAEQRSRICSHDPRLVPAPINTEPITG